MDIRENVLGRIEEFFDYNAVMTREDYDNILLDAQKGEENEKM